MLADSSLSADQRANLRALYPASMLDEGRIPGCCWCRLSEEQEGNNSGSWKGHDIFDRRDTWRARRSRRGMRAMRST